MSPQDPVPLLSSGKKAPTRYHRLPNVPPTPKEDQQGPGIGPQEFDFLEVFEDMGSGIIFRRG